VSTQRLRPSSACLPPDCLFVLYIVLIPHATPFSILQANRASTSLGYNDNEARPGRENGEWVCPRCMPLACTPVSYTLKCPSTNTALVRHFLVGVI
jgi:hypothetical protein